MRPRIAVSVSLEKPDPERGLFKNKPLQYLEETMLLSLVAAGGLPFLVPDLKDERFAGELLEGFDGLVLSGGTDVAPSTYGQTPQRAEWAGDAARDAYELALLHAAVAGKLPILGICRGCQLINVGFGGTLWQDLASQVDGACVHRDPVAYDGNEHGLEVHGGSILADVFGAGPRVVNSVHHQAVCDVGSGLRTAAVADDGTIEAVESFAPGSFVVGVQWHPEWRVGPAGTPASGPSVADPLLSTFVEAARSTP